MLLAQLFDFIHPGALWLGAAAALPLIIHLLSRQKPRVIRFPAVRFIRRSQRRSSRRTNLKHLLLLLLRMGLIGFFALLIARPVLHKGAVAAGEVGAAGTPAAVLVLDDSLSMNHRAGDESWFDTARSRALELAGRLPRGTAAAVLTTSHPKGKLDRELDVLLGRIQGLRGGTRSNSCWRALESAAEMLRETGASRRDVVLFTDMTESAWLGHERRVVDLGQDVNVFVLDCATDDASNGAVWELLQQGEPPMLGAVLSVKVRIVASGAPHARTVQFEFDGTPVERRVVDLQAGEDVALSFSALLSESGHHWGRVSFLNPDALPQDDARAFTVEVAPEVSVLCVEDEPQKTFESVSHFFRLALNPWGEGRRGVFRIERASPGQLKDMPLGPFDVVVLLGAGRMDAAAWRRLDRYVSGGGGMLIFLGPETAETYADEAARLLLPARVGQELVAPPESPFRPRILKSDHPVMAALKEAGARFTDVRFRRCRQVRPAADAEELLSFGPDLPALVLREAGGKVALFASTADERWGDFAATPAFVPFCHELLFHLARRTAGGIKSFLVGAQVPILFEPSSWPTIVSVTAPGARGPDRLLPGTTPGRRTYWKTDAPGYYRVEFEQHGERWRSGFAVNTAPAESRLEKVPFEKVKESIKAGTVEMVTEAAFAEGEIKPGGGAREATPYLALLALALLVAECFLANRFYRSEKT